MRNIYLKIAYDGTNFHGWQRQKENERSIQETIEEVLKKIHGGITIEIVASGRTDQGVHARGQVAHFHTPDAITSPESFQKSLNSLLPKDISILQALEVPLSFHARYSVSSRLYRYYFVMGRTPLPWEKNRVWAILKPLNIQSLNQRVLPLIGKHDFTSFCASKAEVNHKIREIFTAHFYMQGDVLVFEIKGTAFLWHMVRSIVGCIINLEQKKLPLEKTKEILLSKDKRANPYMAPALGLSLEEVTYPIENLRLL